uniref:ribosomal protein L35 n=1 Tax=Hypnea cornuta TaxID=105603 RepID=UPI0027DA7CB6|nr:ribosomal protein L35 [Hypnea cornuta]YP_010903489.1 ribosomal protein L35 [Hypnea cryptica]WCH55744.1 ribosomal protein L35 [Hypnea cornuta]WCH55942.1 ribosomal protein L35 [Hypnea cryptica]
MPKLKTSKSIFKRFYITSSGRLIRHCASRSHLLQKKKSKRKQRLRKKFCVNSNDLSNFMHKLPYVS